MNHMRCILMALSLGAAAQAAVQPDDWAQYNKDGHQRNASDRTLSGTPYVAWARSFTNYNKQQYPANAFSGQRANNLIEPDEFSGRVHSYGAGPRAPVERGLRARLQRVLDFEPAERVPVFGNKCSLDWNCFYRCGAWHRE